MIWEYALSGWSVLAPGYCCAAFQHVGENRAKMAVLPIRPEHHLAGLACREARHLLEKFFARLTFRHSRGCNLTAVYWVNMETTILYLDMDPAPVEFLVACDAKALSSLQHVAMRWNTHNISPIARACQLLAARTPDLQTIIIHISDESSGQGQNDAGFCSRIAACYPNILGNHGPEHGFQGLDCEYLRTYLLDHFADPPPRVHILPPATTNCSN